MYVPLLNKVTDFLFADHHAYVYSNTLKAHSEPEKTQPLMWINSW